VTCLGSFQSLLDELFGNWLVLDGPCRRLKRSIVLTEDSRKDKSRLIDSSGCAENACTEL